MPYDVVDAVETDLTAATGEDALDGWWYDTDETDREPYVSQLLLCEPKLWAIDASHEYLRYRGGDRSELAAERQRGPRRDAATPRHGGQRRAAVSGVPDRDDGSVFACADTGPVGLLDTLTRVARQALSVREGNEDDRSTASVEGSPVHPAYPSGHSVVAGVCSTVLKTWVTDVALPYDDYVPTAGGQSRDTVSPVGPRRRRPGDRRTDVEGRPRADPRRRPLLQRPLRGVELGEQLAVGGLADVFERSSEADESTLPTFEPYLEYGADAVREVSVATLDDLRQEATSRDSPSEQGSRRPKAAGRWRSVERR